MKATSPPPAPTSSGSARSNSRSSARPPSQPDFNRAMALYHSFAWPEAMAAFDAIAKKDPACGMAHWGRAMVMLDNPFVWPGSLSAGQAEGRRRRRRRRPLGRPQEPAREGLRGRARRLRARPREGRPPAAPARLRRRHGQARCPLSRRQGGLDPLGADHLGQLRSRRQDLRQPAQGREDPGAAVCHPAGPSRRRALPDPQLRLSRPSPRRDWKPPSATPRSPRTPRTRCTCRPTSSRASATGRSRSRPTAPPPRPPATAPTTRITPSITWSTRICSSARRRPRGACWRSRGP